MLYLTYKSHKHIDHNEKGLTAHCDTGKFKFSPLNYFVSYFPSILIAIRIYNGRRLNREASDGVSRHFKLLSYSERADKMVLVGPVSTLCYSGSIIC